MAYKPKMPTEEEIREKAIEIYYREHPEARELGITPEEYELRPPEGYYYLKAQRELMAGVRSQLEEALNMYKAEIDEIIASLEEIGVKAPEWALPKEELEARIVRLENRIAGLKTALDRTRREKEKVEHLLKETREILAKKEAELARKREIEKRYVYKMATVKFTRHVPAFMAIDEKVYGPFYTDQIASIPEADAAKLIRQGAAQPWAIPAVKPALPPEKEELRRRAEEAFDRLATAVEHDEYYEIEEVLKKLREIGAETGGKLPRPDRYR